jgi:serine/threonine protein kinase
MPKTPLHPNGVVVLGNTAGALQLETNALGETSIAQTLMSDRKETEKWMINTYAHYIAPEVFGRLNVPVDARADIFSLGCILYETLSGHPPATGTDLLSKIHQVLAVEPTPLIDLIPELPVELSKIVSKCLAKIPRERYMNAHSLRYDLEELLRAWQNRKANTDSTGTLIDVGEMDYFSRFRLSDKLVGVEDSVATMKDAISIAAKGELTVVSIGGSSGTGKTTLALSIRRQVEEIGGRLCVGKYDRYAPRSLTDGSYHLSRLPAIAPLTICLLHQFGKS